MHVSDQPVCVGVALGDHHAAVGEHAQRFDREQRDAAGVIAHGFPQLRGRVGDCPGDERLDLLGGERRQVHAQPTPEERFETFVRAD